MAEPLQGPLRAQAAGLFLLFLLVLGDDARDEVLSANRNLSIRNPLALRDHDYAGATPPAITAIGSGFGLGCGAGL